MAPPDWLAWPRWRRTPGARRHRGGAVLRHRRPGIILSGSGSRFFPRQHAECHGWGPLLTSRVPGQNGRPPGAGPDEPMRNPACSRPRPETPCRRVFPGPGACWTPGRFSISAAPELARALGWVTARNTCMVRLSRGTSGKGGDGAPWPRPRSTVWLDRAWSSERAAATGFAGRPAADCCPAHPRRGPLPPWAPRRQGSLAGGVTPRPSGRAVPQLNRSAHPAAQVPRCRGAPDRLGHSPLPIHKKSAMVGEEQGHLCGALGHLGPRAQKPVPACLSGSG